MTTNLPPAAGQRVTTVSLTVEAQPDGRYRISSPHARGWAVVVGTPWQLAKAVTLDAFNEVSAASYARAQGEHYDLDALTERVIGDPLAGKPAPRKRAPAGTRTRTAYHPAAWSKMEDGKWRSPGGRVYGPQTRQVQGMIKRRLAQGLTI